MCVEDGEYNFAAVYFILIMYPTVMKYFDRVF